MVKRMAAYLSGRKTVIRRLLWILSACVVILDFFVPRHAPHFWGDAVPGFWSVFGCAGCLVLVLVSKSIGGKLRIPERGGDDDE